MKGDQKVIHKLNDLLRDELTSINQYVLHAEMCENWGYERLHNITTKRAREEMKHAEMLIARILFLQGMPDIGTLGAIHIGSDVAMQHKNDLAAENVATKSYNDGINLAMQVADHRTRELLDSILKDEESHIDFLEAQLDQITQMGIANYLEAQIKA